MFMPQTAHVPRTYGGGHHSHAGHPTTSRKNVNKENAFAMPTKTPSRIKVYGGGDGGSNEGGAPPGKSMMLGKPGVTPGPSMRQGLGVKSEARNRNVIQDGPGGGGGGKGDKGKGKDGMDLEPKRLFASSSKSSIQPSKSQTFAPLKTPARAPPPASTRTLQNIRTPAPRQHTVFRQPTEAPAQTPLPSATRARRRSRQSLNSSASGSSTKGVATPSRDQRDAFQTPAPDHRWEEEHSLESIGEAAGPQPELLETMQEAVEEVDVRDWEVEYMPPRAEELPYEPPFDMPDLQEIFGRMAAAPPLWTLRDSAPKSFELDPDVLLDVEAAPFHGLRPDDDLEDPLFKSAKPAAEAGPKLSAPALKKTVTIAPTASIARPRSTGGSAAPAAATVRPKPVSVARPSTSGRSKENAPTLARSSVREPTKKAATAAGAAPSTRRPLSSKTPVAPLTATAPPKSAVKSAAPAPAKPQFQMPVFEDAYRLGDDLDGEIPLDFRAAPFL